LNTIERKKYWDSIYKSKPTNQRSWYQEVPSVSLEFISGLKLPLVSKILDNGAGDSFFVDSLLGMGYVNITVSDISAAALDIVKKRLGERASEVKWVVADEASCDLGDNFDLWHDRAAFHFLTDENEIKIM
jgi:hypothetical protein